MRVSQNFVVQEFIPPEIWERFGESSIWFMDKRIINLAQAIRDRVKLPVTINNWHTGGDYKYSGFDPPGGYRDVKSLSQHRFSRAMDIKIKGIFPRDVAKEIIDNFTIYKKYGLTTIEDPDFTSTWTHADIIVKP